MSATTTLVPVVLITGDDAAMVATEVRLVLDGLLGDRDPALVIE